MKKAIIIITMIMSILLYDKVEASTLDKHWMGEITRPTNTWNYSSLNPIYMSREIKTYNTYMTDFEFSNGLNKNKVEKVYINGYITGLLLDRNEIRCSQWNGDYCLYADELNQLELQIWLGNASQQCKMNWNNINMSNVGADSYVFWQAECPLEQNTTYNSITYRIYAQDTRTTEQNYELGFNRMIYFSQSDSQEIINNQNQNYNNFMDTNSTYNDQINTNMNGANETIEYNQQEQQLLDSLDINTTMLDSLYVNSNANSFIWDIVGGLRSMNPAIITLMSTMLALGIVKMVLGR